MVFHHLSGITSKLPKETEGNSDVRTLLKKHFGIQWDEIEDLLYFKTFFIITNPAAILPQEDVIRSLGSLKISSV